MKQLGRDDVLNSVPLTAHELMQRWLDRGDHIAVYENHDLGHPELGHRKVVSYGSPAAFLEVPEPPTRLPDTPTEINWRYQLVGVFTDRSLDLKVTQ